VPGDITTLLLSTDTSILNVSSLTDSTNVTVGSQSNLTSLVLEGQDVSILTSDTYDVTSVVVSSGEVTIVQLISNTSTTSDITVLNTSSATLTLPATVSFTNDIPTELANVGSSGTALTAARSDHVHPSTGMTVNGGNY
jgi:hypothetical protein